MVEKPDIPPFELAKEILEEAAKQFGCDEVADLREVDYKRVLMSLHPGIEAIVLAHNRVFYRVEEATADQLAVMSHGNKVIFEIVREICHANVWNGEPVPEPLRAICSQLILGKKVGFSESGAIPGRNFAIQWVTTRMISYLCDAYSIKKTRSDASPSDSAVEYAKNALESFGIHYSYNAIRDWTRPHKNSQFTLWADALDDFLNEETMIALGLSKRRKLRILNPWGQFARMHLSTAAKHR
ncbi:hypothetical protein [Thalassovita sp.]|uniref:hypothetical protein n=1 Tax=Thalassovita sp. TaxID=1979401 RepID=UPI002B26C939|nr:hypothetical protein [Thalassovita sp.]